MIPWHRSRRIITRRGGEPGIGFLPPFSTDNISQLIHVWQHWRDEGYKVYFRGENDCLDYSSEPFPLQPSLMRPPTFNLLSDAWGGVEGCELERVVFDRFKRHAAHLIEDDAAFAGRSMKDLEKLCLSQHFGLPTRLLDWSLNPLVALYFSLAGDGNFSLYKPARLWVMVLKEEDERKASTIHLESDTEDDPDLEGLFERIKSLEILKDSKAYGSKFREDPYVVVPLVFTKRISAQYGRFLYCPNITTPTDRLDTCISKHVQEPNAEANTPLPTEAWKIREKEKSEDPTYFDPLPEMKDNSARKPWKHLLCYPVDHLKNPERTKPEKLALLQNLEFRGVNAGSLFPDISGWAKYIRQGFK